jgi:hypothetical protein
MIYKCPRPNCVGTLTQEYVTEHLDELIEENMAIIEKSAPDKGKTKIACPKCGLWMKEEE